MRSRLTGSPLSERSSEDRSKEPQPGPLLDHGSHDDLHEGPGRSESSGQDPEQQTKVFVLDTNVVLHDSNCLSHFEDNDIALPLALLEELDRFKRGSEDIHFHAREFLRRLDELSGDVLDPDGVPLGPGLGTFRVIATHGLSECVRQRFRDDNADHRILSTALELSRETADREVVLVSKDTNLRMKAKSLGLVAQDFHFDRVEVKERLYPGRRLVEGIDSETISGFYEDAGEMPLDAVPQVVDPTANENFILRNGSRSVLATYRADRDMLRRIPRASAFGIQARNAEQSFALNALLDDSVSLVTLCGKAGTGKTLLALAAALERRSSYRQILLARPIVPMGNRGLGFLPGDADEKVAPYMQPLYDNLSVIRHQLGEKHENVARLQRMQEAGKLVVTPLAYIRGRTLPRVYFIVDEAQNLTPHEVKTIVTRAGEGTKVVLTGDIHQIDSPYLDPYSNGLSTVISRMAGQPLYAHVTLEKGERSALSNLAGELL